MTTSSQYQSGPAPEVHFVAAGRGTDRWPWVALVLIAALAAIAVAVIVAMGHQQRPAGVGTVAQVAAQRSPSVKVVTRTVAGPAKTIIREVPVSAPAPIGPSPAGSSCGGGIDVNGQTSCAFAQNVVEQYRLQAEQAGAPGSFDVYAYSPVTEQSYTDLCSYNPSDALVSCTHGSDLIQFAYANVSVPVSNPAPSYPVSASGSCGGITVNAQTSCAFAQNVAEQYTRDAERAGAPSSFDVSAYSPVTGKSYIDTCRYSGSTGIVSCSHGSDLVQFAYGSR